jgi:hypothetical protein
MHGATAAKSAVEDKQRDLAKRRESVGDAAPASRFFTHVEGDRWMPKIGVDRYVPFLMLLLDSWRIRLPKDPQEMEDVVRKWIFGDKSSSGSEGASSRKPTVTSNEVHTQGPAPTHVPAAGPAPTQTRIGAESPSQAPPFSATSIGGSTSATSTGSVPEPRMSLSLVVAQVDLTLAAAVVTAPGPPAPGPKLAHPPQ